MNQVSIYLEFYYSEWFRGVLESSLKSDITMLRRSCKWILQMNK
jgi:hypothetical protein